jgi:DNA primase
VINYRGRKLDGAALWEEFVDFPPNADLSGGFAPLVVCPNPEHGSNKRHFQVNLDKPLVHCFASCGISGTYEKAIAKIKGISEKEARKLIVRHTRVELGPASKRKRRGTDGKVRLARPVDAPDKPEDLGSFDRYLPAVALEYLETRGIGGGAISAWGLGWDADDRRIVIPADDERGITRFLIKRAVREKDWPKYLYWPEGATKTAVLFGACKLDRKQVSSLGLVLVEGSLDTICQQEYGVPAGGILGTGLSDRQAQIIRSFRPKRIYHMFDRDGAGVKNIIMASEKLTSIPNFVCLYPKGKGDPAELTGKESWRIIENAISLSAFKRRLRERGIDLKVTKPERRNERKVPIG